MGNCFKNMKPGTSQAEWRCLLPGLDNLGTLLNLLGSCGGLDLFWSWWLLYTCFVVPVQVSTHGWNLGALWSSSRTMSTWTIETCTHTVCALASKWMDCSMWGCVSGGALVHPVWNVNVLICSMVSIHINGRILGVIGLVCCVSCLDCLMGMQPVYPLHTS